MQITKENVLMVKEVRSELTKLFNDLSTAYSNDNVVYELMGYRKYDSQEMFDTLKEIGVFRLDYLSELLLASDITKEQLMSFGLLNKNGDYLLGSRFVIPIRDISGSVIALVGWDKDGGSRKYVTTPTLGFSRDVSFFNIECYKDAMIGNKCVYLVEGIFDAISLRSLGFNALGNQGLVLSKLKSQILRRFGKVIAIPDNDNSGKSVSEYTNSITSKGEKAIWRIENENVFVSLPKGVKDVDDFIKYFDAYEDLLSCQSAKYIKKLSID